MGPVRDARGGRAPTLGRPTWATVSLAVLVLLSAACAPAPAEPTGAAPNGLNASLDIGHISLTWEVSPDVTGGYDLEARVAGGPWLDMPHAVTATASYSPHTNRVDHSFRVRSAATANGPAGAWSQPVSIFYVDLVLPVVRIDTTEGAPVADTETYVRGGFRIDPNGSGYDGYSGTMGIRGRGNTTWEYPKKPYRVKLDAASPIMGIAAERDWVLLANYIEESQLRTYAAMELSRATEMAYTPTVRHVEVVFNGRYDGVYLLTQHTEVGSDRVDIARMGPGDTADEAVTGGYLLEIDQRLEWNDEPGFRTSRGVPIVVKDPEPMVDQQLSYIRGRISEFETALFGAGFADPLTGFRPYVHMESFIDHYLVQEVTRNEDAFWSSTYLTKDRGEDGFRFGPVWDFDRSLGSNHNIETSPQGWWARTRGPWMPRALEDPTFVGQMVQRWDELKPVFTSIANGLVPTGDALRPAVDNDAARWRYLLHRTDQPTFVRDWLLARIAWMDDQFH